jgi:hypothetical protein
MEGGVNTLSYIVPYKQLSINNISTSTSKHSYTAQLPYSRRHIIIAHVTVSHFATVHKETGRC